MPEVMLPGDHTYVTAPSTYCVSHTRTSTQVDSHARGLCKLVPNDGPFTWLINLSSICNLTLTV